MKRIISATTAIMLIAGTAMAAPSLRPPHTHEYGAYGPHGARTHTNANHVYGPHEMPWMTLSSRCLALENEFDQTIKGFDQEIKDPPIAMKSYEAKTLRDDGGQLCTSDKMYEGVKKIRRALNDIGVTAEF